MCLVGQESHPSHFRRNVDLMKQHTVKTSLITGEDRISLTSDAVNIKLMSDTGTISVLSDA